MNMKKTEFEKSMEYMLELLHDEWSMSGKTKTNVLMDKDEIDKAFPIFAFYIRDMQSYVDSDDITFKESMVYSKEAFVALRLLKKMKKASEKEKGTHVLVPLDKEELNTFKEIILLDYIEHCYVK